MIRRPPISTRTDTLFPYTTLFRSVVADSSREQRAVSALLAVMSSVDEFGKGLLKSLGAPANKSSRIECFTEVVFQNSRSEEHTSELQSLMRISYAVFCLKKKTTTISVKM